YIRSDQRMQRTVRAHDSISRTLVRRSEGPRAVLDEIAGAAGEHLFAEWVVMGLFDGQLTSARPRFIALDADGKSFESESELPRAIRRELAAIKTGLSRPKAADDNTWVRVSMTLEGQPVGSLVVLHGLDAAPEPGDYSLLRILANQAAVALHTAEQYQSGLDLHRRAQQLYDEANAQARDLAARTSQLRQTEERLAAAHQRELLDSERHRIARELHDSVSQLVLSAGMSVEIARGDTVNLGEPAEKIALELARAKALTQRAVQQLSDAIYSLHHPVESDAPATLPDILAEMVTHYRPLLDATLTVEGGALPGHPVTDHELARIAGEALFNVASHAQATRVVVRLRNTRGRLVLSVADDGKGDPLTLRRLLRIESRAVSEASHRGLSNMATRAEGLGGTFTLRRSRLGGVQVTVTVPLDPREVAERSDIPEDHSSPEDHNNPETPSPEENR
ncbi:MAG: histidine kinase, partial [Aeromicrobium sp.]